jgi:hypothetical protein
VIAKLNDGSHILAEGKGTDAPKAIEQFKEAGQLYKSKYGKEMIVSRQEIVVEEGAIKTIPDYDDTGKLIGYNRSLNGMRIPEGMDTLEELDLHTRKWMPVRVNGAPVHVVVAE